MSEFLFRQEVACFHDDPRFGEKIFYQPIQLRIFVIALLIVVFCFGIFASLAPVRQTEMVRGHLDPKQGAMKVFSPSAGTVSEVLVRDGDTVHSGQVLARITRSTFDSSGHAALDYSLYQIDVQITQQSRHKTLLVKRSKLNAEKISAQLQAKQQELDAMLAQLHVIKMRHVLSEREVQRQSQLLAKKQTASAQHERALDTLYSLEQAAQSVQAQIKSATGAMLVLQQQLDQEPFTRQAQLLEIEKLLAQLRARRAELEVDDAYTITAPSDGIVSNLLAMPGTSVNPRVPFLTLLPVTNDMQALLYVPSRALGSLEEAQQVLLSYDAYPSRVFGYFPARIERIADTILDPREHIFPLDVQEPIYLVRATPDLNFEGSSDNLNFRSGMQFSAYVVTGQQSLLQRLLSPLQRLRSRV